jgi:hypothetical protein
MHEITDFQLGPAILASCASSTRAGGGMGVFGCIACSVEIINLIYGATWVGGCVWMH